MFLARQDVCNQRGKASRPEWFRLLKERTSRSLHTLGVRTVMVILTPMLMVIVMITGDFLGMSLTTDHVRPSPLPNAWRIGRLTVAGVFMGIADLLSPRRWPSGESS